MWRHGALPSTIAVCHTCDNPNCMTTHITSLEPGVTMCVMLWQKVDTHAFVGVINQAGIS